MDRRLLAVALLAALAFAAAPVLSAPHGPPTTRAFTLEVTAGACPYGDGVCLAYNGQVPGPTFDVNLGDTLVVTLVNRIAETLPPGAAEHLARASVSWHVHGMAVSVANDGVGESSAPPGGSFTYTTRAAFAGSWHYHDHVIGFDGDEGAGRGLYGGIIVRNGAEPRPDAVFDLHLLDAGPNGGRGLHGNVSAGSDFELLVIGLENIGWKVELRDPAGALVGRFDAWPGLSGRIVVEDAKPGSYVWRASGFGVRTGEVRVS
ncbi:MAG TPA: multicopper oxidase domain-containing protein [Candidatus Thermoplasmatota archaeon]|nr:multicopper oxidase domain-containing protein [Candidatus Thermoplasmatota archaeon]